MSKNDLKTRAVAAPLEGAGEVVGHAVNLLPQDVGSTMPSLRNMKQVVYRARRSANAAGRRAPPDRKTGWAFPEEMKFLPDGTPFLLHDSGENDPQRFIIMGSVTALEKFGTESHFFSDGMFGQVPVFQQLYSIHVDYVRHFLIHFPLIFPLLLSILASFLSILASI